MSSEIIRDNQDMIFKKRRKSIHGSGRMRAIKRKASYRFSEIVMMFLNNKGVWR